MCTRRLSLSERDSLARGDGGVVLILAVFAVVLLTVLAVGISAVVRPELLASRTSLDRMQSLFLAEAGLNQARATLLYDDVTCDSLFDDWGTLCEYPLDLPQQLGSGFHRVRVHDACGRIDVNRTDVVALTRLTGDAEAAAAIIAWRDGGGDFGPLEDAYYASLPQPYVPRHGPLQTLGELLLVRGVTPAIFFGDAERPGLADLLTVESVSLNTDANGNRRTGLNEFRNWSEEKFRQALIEKLSGVITMYEIGEIYRGYTELVDLGTEYTSLDQLATAAGLDYETIARLVDFLDVESGLWTQGKVNVNTAPPAVLAALPGCSQRLAEAIASRRDERPFTSRSEVAEFLLGQSSGPDAFLQMIGDVTTKSSTFTIESMGWTETGHAFRTVRALVRRRPDSVTIACQTEEDWPLPPLQQNSLVAAGR
jgi:type II secretory pathway component PulK